ncbi:hypothetical protein [Catenulispora sp. GAS73]|uniref:hypothetical protein n=1 Tax=Catenulispora sp. GAS73 TaxID=3156269 RepID=UPI003518FBE8
MAIVSISPPVTADKIALITFGSLTAAVAAPMVENRIANGPIPPRTDRPGATGDSGIRTRDSGSGIRTGDLDNRARPETPAPRRRRGGGGGDATEAKPPTDVLYTLLQSSPDSRTSVVGREQELKGVARRLVVQRNADSK